MWNQVTQVGKEVTPGTGVAATRKMYMTDPVFAPGKDFRPYRFATGTRDNQRGATLGPLQVGGQVQFPMSADEIVEILLGCVQGSVTPTLVAAGVQLWTFKPAATLPDSQTWEWHDGARPWRETGVRWDTLRVNGAANGPNMVTAAAFALNHTQQALTGALADRTPSFIEGWETKYYVDAHGGTPGGTVVSGTLIDWDLNFRNNLDRKFFADNANQTGAIIVNPMDATAVVTIEASTAHALTEFNNWNVATKRLLRFEFGQNVVISGANKTFVTIDLPCAWSVEDLGNNDRGTRTYKMTGNYVYDPTNAFGIQFRAQNARATAYA
jgi:hypothetical protein